MDKAEIQKYKHDCHRLLDKIWGEDKDGRNLAYTWLRLEFGQEIHFSQVNDLEFLKKIKDRLLVHSVLYENERFLDGVHDNFRKKNSRNKWDGKKKRREDFRKHKYSW